MQTNFQHATNGDSTTPEKGKRYVICVYSGGREEMNIKAVLQNVKYTEQKNYTSATGFIVSRGHPQFKTCDASNTFLI